MGQTLDSLVSYTNTIANATETKTAKGIVLGSNGVKRYYSSIDANICIGNTYIDEVVAIMFRIQQGTMPLFGYNSYVYDDVAQGQRIVQGNFMINMTKPNFLFEILEVAKKDSSVFYSQSDSSVKTTNKSTSDASTSFGDTSKANWDAAFDIDVILGNTNSVHYILEGVVINSSELHDNGSGDNIKETYGFIARNITTIQ